MGHHTRLAPRPSRNTNLAPVEYQQVGQQGPTLRGEQPHEVRFDLLGGLFLGEREQRGESLHVGVAHDTLIDPERVPQDDVRGRPPHTRQLRQLLHRVRNVAAV